MKALIYHVAKHGDDSAKGTEAEPFLTINQAANVAEAGDRVVVHEGEYREWVKPKNKGLSNKHRIIYEVADNEKVVVKGSERVSNWENIDETVWKVKVSNDLFGSFNPYAVEVDGDFMTYYTDERKHLGDVYLNGESFYEVNSYEEVVNPNIKSTTVDDWTKGEVKRQNPNQTKYVWFAEVHKEHTVIYANFHGANPNHELVEINVRESVFYPTETGRDYITVRGFEMAHAATPWAPPTADQTSLIGPNWSKGWIIEDNIIHDAKCSAISIGKEKSTGHNFSTIYKDKSGYQYQVESVFSALDANWNKENVGSHIVRNNTIYNCGQNAIFGHLGCIFSEIYGNHIYNIGTKYEFIGHEVAGIKLHAAIDVQIYNNRIHNCTLGTWLDWQTQGTRLSKNIYYENNRDLFVEVSHGPYVVDHNIFASPTKLDIFAQGGAYVNNLFYSTINRKVVLDRSTPYHVPHSTKIAGVAVVYDGDDRFFGNVFVESHKTNSESTGTEYFDDYPTSLEEYIEKVQEYAPGDLDIYKKVNQPVYINNNMYLNGAQSFEQEENKIELKEFNPKIKIIEEKESVYLSILLPDEIMEWKGEVQTTSTLPLPRIASFSYEESDESELILDTDLLENKNMKSNLGPIYTLELGENKIKIW